MLGPEIQPTLESQREGNMRIELGHARAYESDWIAGLIILRPADKKPLAAGINDRLVDPISHCPVHIIGQLIERHPTGDLLPWEHLKINQNLQGNESDGHRQDAL